MALRRLLAWVSVAALGACVWTGCKGNDHGLTPDLVIRCEQLGKTCGDGPKHVHKIAKECEQAVAAQVAKGCTKQTVALFDCYEKKVCGKKDKIWALNDLRVLSKRHRECSAERKVSRECDQKRKAK